MSKQHQQQRASIPSPVNAFHGELPFTLKDIKQAIPKHCFERPLLKSLLHLFSDLVQIVVYTVAYYYFSQVVSDVWNFHHDNVHSHQLITLSQIVYYSIQTVLFLSYVFIQGTTFTGLWVLQHECGHYAFSDSALVCDIVGFVVGSALLVPYFAWQKSHAIHHANTNHMERDQTWVPQTIQEVPFESVEAKTRGPTTPKHATTQSDFRTFIDILVMTTVGWPLHLLFNVSGPIKENVVAYYVKGKRYEPTHLKECDNTDKAMTIDVANDSVASNDISEYNPTNKKNPVTFTSHYIPSSPIFTKKEAIKIHLSNFGVLGMLCLLYKLFIIYGWQIMMTVYVLPLCVNFFFLTSITFLQHVDDSIPHMDEDEWTWLKGALCTVDRHMGSSFIDSKLHHIHDTHVCHHLFSKIPFYHAKEATEAIKKVVGTFYREETEKTFIVSLWENLKNCIVLKRDEKYPGLLWWDH